MDAILSTVKKLLPLILLVAIDVHACNKECNQKPPPFDCEEAMHTYAKNIEHYSNAAEEVDLIKLKKFSGWLTENSSIQITCGAYNQNKSLDPNYKVILLESMKLNNSIKLLIDLKKLSIKADEDFAKQLQESYLLIHNATKVFTEQPKKMGLND